MENETPNIIEGEGAEFDQPTSVVYNADGSITLKKSAITYNEFRPLTGTDRHYYLIKGDLDQPFGAPWEEWKAWFDVGLKTSPVGVVVTPDTITIFRGKLGYSMSQDSAGDWHFKATLGLTYNTDLQLTDTERDALISAIDNPENPN